MSSRRAMRDVSDTAVIAATARARETDEQRRRPILQDPYAARLAGERGRQLARKRSYQAFYFGVIARTAVFDEFIHRALDAGATHVINLGAGLDARPYRLDLPADLCWLEADLPAVIDYKANLLSDNQPGCPLERHGVDLADGVARRTLLDLVPADGSAIVVTEGVVPYLYEDDVAHIAAELAERASCRWWALDLLGARLARIINFVGHRQLAAADAFYRFAPNNGAEFFRPLGWNPVDVRSALLEQRRLGCEPRPLHATWVVSPRRLREAIEGSGSFVLLKRQ